jgi:hypothetical protein
MTIPQPKPEPPPENVVPFRKRLVAPPKPKPASVEDAAGDDRAIDDRARDRTNVAVLALAAVLVFLGWLLVRELGRSAHVQDCFASGRTNCAPIETPVRE